MARILIRHSCDLTMGLNAESKLPNYRDIYTSFYGPIPKGWVVHHIDHNRANNSKENLIALPEAFHNVLHTNMRRQGVKFDRSMTESYLRDFLKYAPRMGINVNKASWMRQRVKPRKF